jgi:hypothetical protein
MVRMDVVVLIYRRIWMQANPITKVDVFFVSRGSGGRVLARFEVIDEICGGCRSFLLDIL